MSDGDEGSDVGDFGWLDWYSRRGAPIAVASCFTFVRGVPAAAAVEFAGLADAHAVDWSSGPDRSPDWFGVVVAHGAADGWTVLYQDNGFPEQFGRELAARAEVSEAVIVFWNVNAVTEFSYWRSATEVVRFEWPHRRSGSDPDALLPAMKRNGVTLETHDADTGEPTYYRALLALAADITGVILTADFLDRPVVLARLTDDM